MLVTRRGFGLKLIFRLVTTCVAACWRALPYLLCLIIGHYVYRLFVTDWDKELLKAIRANDHAKLQVAIRHNARVNIKFNEGNLLGITPLILATVNNHAVLVAILISTGAKVDECSEKGKSALNFACKYGNLSLVQLLLAKGADVNSKTTEGLTPLITACVHGHLHLINTLVAYKADIKWKTLQGHNALISALGDVHLDFNNEHDKITLNNRENIIKLLVKKGANIESKTVAGWTPLTKACSLGIPEFVEIFLRKGADINASDNTGFTPLSAACQNGWHDIVLLLFDTSNELREKHRKSEEKQLIVDKAMANGTTALVAACHGGHTEIVKLLLKYGANINVKFKSEYNALMVAIVGGHDEVAFHLIEKGIDISHTNTDNKTDSLFMAVEYNRYNIACKLLEHDADPNTLNKYGWSALMKACEKNRVDMALLLLSYNADVNHMKGCWNALSIAVCCGYYEITDILLQNNSIIRDGGCVSQHSDEEEDNAAPLLVAVETGNAGIAQLLLNYDANPNIVNRKGISGLSLALTIGNIDIVLLLQQFGAVTTWTQKFRLAAIRVYHLLFSKHKNSTATKSQMQADNDIKLKEE